MLALLAVAAVALGAGARPAAAGETELTPPRNVEVDIIDDTFTLRWDRSWDSAGDVTVSAGYQIPGTVDSWTDVPGCQRVTGPACEFSSLHDNVYEEVRLRVRAEEGGRASPWRELDPFIPFQRARIGPPKVRLEAEDKAVAVHLSPPGAEDGAMWQLDHLNFAYSVVFWSNASGAQTRNETLQARYPRIKIHRLAPETTYCVKAKARLITQRNPGEFSPVHCVSTTVENELPAPENLQVVLDNQAYVLTWDYPHDNVTFQVQWLSSYLKRFPGSRAEKWAPVRGCEHSPAPRCPLPWATLRSGGHLLRVRASRGDAASAWSQEEKFASGRPAALPPPTVALKPLDGHALQVAIGFPDPAAFPPDLLTYSLRLWENASARAAEKTFVEQKSDFPVRGLQPRTVYCAEAQALLDDGPRSRLSPPSPAACAQTPPAGGAPGAWLAAGLSAVLTALLVLGAAATLGRLVRYVFFPSRAPPAAIHEYFPEEPVKRLLLAAAAERTERCFVIEDADPVSTDTGRPEDDHKAYSSQTSQDLGNYSIEDESGGSQGRQEPCPGEGPGRCPLPGEGLA